MLQLLWSCLLLFHYRILAFCFRNRDKQMDAAQCLACHRHDSISSELLHNPILVSQTRLRQLLESRLLLRHYLFVAFCLRNRDEQSDAGQCLDCHQDYGISSELLLIPILVSQTRLRQLLRSRLLLHHYRFLAFCFRNRDEQMDAAQCLACHRHDGISSELLLIPILVSQTRLRRLLGSRLLLRHYRFVAYCLRNCDESRDAAKCLDCHQDYRISSELLLNPILIS